MKNIESIAEKYADLIMQDTASKSANVPTQTQYARVLAAIREAVETEVPRLFNLEYECKAAGFVTAEGEVRKVLGRLWTTDDGCILGFEYEGYLYREVICGDIQRSWPSVCLNNIDMDYKWYSTPEAARAAKENAQ